MNIWYSLTPVDTLFFRGAEPLEAGQLDAQTLFPPPVSVVSGALRTTLLKQRSIPIAAYKEASCAPEILDAIGRYGQQAPFKITALFLRKDGEDFLPCPASWFVNLSMVEQNNDAASGSRYFMGCTLLRPKPTALQTSTLRLSSSAGLDLPMLPIGEPMSLAGFWMRRGLLENPPETLAQGDILPITEFYDAESRTGIGLDRNRKVEKGKLYTARHIRLRQGVSFIIGVDRELGLKNSGMVQLGGEQRLCGYETTEVPPLPKGSAPCYMNLAPVELAPQMLEQVYYAPKPVTIAGWDLSRRFHKPTVTWLPAGAVFYNNINSICVPLGG